MSGLNLRILRSTEGANKLNGDYAECFEHDEVVQEGDSLGKVFNDISSFLRLRGYTPYFTGQNNVLINPDTVIYRLIHNGHLQMVYDLQREVNMYVVHVSHINPAT
ncbi:hypothetical protein GGI19_003263 [Coemansia pectinata]|uniref:Uncharacterized protein n=1 Tax=Coemansia pectinata TaxID=1052879 RepID=A0A9W8GYJ2_9FUNG|nr:hypothetical protein GGI19_003263 [Coemansia pectinata]